MNIAQHTSQRLVAAGVDRVFCVAGESYLPLLDALRKDSEIEIVPCRHEGGAALMALADGKMTGRPGVCLVSRSPGIANAAIGMDAARLDGAPLLVIAGHVPAAECGRGAFQEVNLDYAYRGLVKGVWVARSAEQALSYLDQAVHLAMDGARGPCLLGICEDVFAMAIPSPVAVHSGPTVSTRAISVTESRQLGGLIAQSQRPILLVGSRAQDADTRSLVRRVAEAQILPVVTTNKRQALMDNLHPLYAGHLHLATAPHQRKAYREADLVLAIGTRLDFVTTAGYTFPLAPVPDQPLVHAYPDPDVLGSGLRRTLPLSCAPLAILEELATTPKPPECVALARKNWADRLGHIEQAESNWVDQPRESDGLPFGSVVAALNRKAPRDLIVTLDAGSFTTWVHRYFRFTNDHDLLALGPGSMGFAIPAAIAASLRYRKRPVLAIVGDGGFAMTGSELATAVQSGASFGVLVANNGGYGSIRLHQDRLYPGRPVAVELPGPNLALLADAYGASATVVRDFDQIDPAIDHALACEGVSIVDVRSSFMRPSANAPVPA